MLPPHYAAKASADSAGYMTEMLHQASAMALQNCKWLQNNALQSENKMCAAD